MILTAIREAITIGSTREQLGWKDFEFYVNSGTNVDLGSSFEELVDAGMPYLDALCLKGSTNVPTDIVIKKRTARDAVVVNYLNIAKGLFCWYFSIYSQGRAIASGSNNYLTQVLSLGNDWSDLVKALTSANIEHFPKRWVKNIDIGILSEETKNRLALGAAGQRYLQALNYILDSDYKENTDVEKRFINGLKKWTKGLVYWDLHPVFKSGQIISVTKSLNKSIDDCLFHALTDAAKKKLTASKVLFGEPKEEPGHAQWRNLDLNSLPDLIDKIF